VVRTPPVRWSRAGGGTDLAGDSTESFFNRLFKRQAFVEVKMNKSSKNKQCISSHSLWQKLSLGKRLCQVWRDLEDNQCWKYDQLSPVQLLEKLELDECRADKDELARAEYFWNRRPRLLPIISYVAWLIVAFGLPFWLFIVPAIGYPLITISAVVVNTEIVRSVRWRRQYELAIDRLIQTSLGVSNFNG
jgi:hypothetical protein